MPQARRASRRSASSWRPDGTPADQDDLVAKEASIVGEALAVEGVLSVNFHRGLDGTRVVNFAQLASPLALERLAGAPTFGAGTAYWRDLARNEFHLYDVVVAVAPRVG